jgi:hypothetical protein
MVSIMVRICLHKNLKITIIDVIPELLLELFSLLFNVFLYVFSHTQDFQSEIELVVIFTIFIIPLFLLDLKLNLINVIKTMEITPTERKITVEIIYFDSIRKQN